MENHLWNNGFLGEENPDQLCNTILFLIGINVYLRAIDEHYGLRRDMPDKRSSITFEYNSVGVKCMVYREDTISKTHNGGLADMRNERKIVWVYPSENLDRCPVRFESMPAVHEETKFLLGVQSQIYSFSVVCRPSSWGELYC